MNYIKSFTNALSSEQCEYLINAFEEAENKVVRDNKVQHFTEVEMGLVDSLKQAEQVICMIAADYLDKYKKAFGIVGMPEHYAFERVRIKKYNAGDSFADHVDVGDYASAKRFLVCMFHLNKDFKGGNTTFVGKENTVVKPQVGQLTMFPPFWTHPHRGEHVAEGTKYILNVYMHYL